MDLAGLDGQTPLTTTPRPGNGRSPAQMEQGQPKGLFQSQSKALIVILYALEQIHKVLSTK